MSDASRDFVLALGTDLSTQQVRWEHAISPTWHAPHAQMDPGGCAMDHGRSKFRRYKVGRRYKVVPPMLPSPAGMARAGIAAKIVPAACSKTP